MPNDIESYYKNQLWWWAGLFFSMGVTASVAAAKFIYIDPRDRDIISMQRQLDEAKSDPESKRLSIQIRQLQANRDEWITLAKNLESKVATCDSNARVLSEISKLSALKKDADQWVDFFLSPNMNAGGDPTKSNLLRAEEYRRQATQLHEQIVGLQAKISQ